MPTREALSSGILELVLTAGPIAKAILVILAFSVIPVAYELWRHRRTSSKRADDNDRDGVPDIDIVGQDTRKHV